MCNLHCNIASAQYAVFVPFFFLLHVDYKQQSTRICNDSSTRVKCSSLHSESKTLRVGRRVSCPEILTRRRSRAIQSPPRHCICLFSPQQHMLWVHNLEGRVVKIAATYSSYLRAKIRKKARRDFSVCLAPYYSVHTL